MTRLFGHLSGYIGTYVFSLFSFTVQELLCFHPFIFFFHPAIIAASQVLCYVSNHVHDDIPNLGVNSVGFLLAVQYACSAWVYIHISRVTPSIILTAISAFILSLLLLYHPRSFRLSLRHRDSPSVMNHHFQTTGTSVVNIIARTFVTVLLSTSILTLVATLILL